MKKGAKLLLCIFIASTCFLTGMFVGRNTKDHHVALLQDSPSNESVAPVVADFRIDINSATKVQLMELHGIGELLAERIVAYREENGPFATIDDLMNVEGIGEKKLKAITEWIKVGE